MFSLACMPVRVSALQPVFDNLLWHVEPLNTGTSAIYKHKHDSTYTNWQSIPMKAGKCNYSRV